MSLQPVSPILAPSMSKSLRVGRPVFGQVRLEPSAETVLEVVDLPSLNTDQWHPACALRTAGPLADVEATNDALRTDIAALRERVEQRKLRDEIAALRSRMRHGSSF